MVMRNIAASNKGGTNHPILKGCPGGSALRNSKEEDQRCWLLLLDLCFEFSLFPFRLSDVNCVSSESAELPV